MSRTPQFRDIILLENDDLIVVNKPANISSLDERDQQALSLLRMAKKYDPEAQLCHRLDKETSGVLIIARNPESYREMAMAFEAREVDKTYHAVVEGVLNIQNQAIHLPLTVTKKGLAKVDVKEGKPAETIVSTIRLFGHYSLLACKPITGRLHQIRIHLASQNFPIVSDVAYGGHMPMLSRFKRNFKPSASAEEHSIMQRIALHAYSVKFTLKGKPYEVKAPYPKDFEVFMKLLEKYEA